MEYERISTVWRLDTGFSSHYRRNFAFSNANCDKATRKSGEYEIAVNPAMNFSLDVDHVRNEQIILKKFLRASVRPVFNESRKRVSIAAVLCSASDHALGVPACRDTFIINFYDSPSLLYWHLYLSEFRRRCTTKTRVKWKIVNLTGNVSETIASCLEMHLHKCLTSRVFFVPESISVREIFCARNHVVRNYAALRCLSLRLVETFQNVSLWKNILIAST